jgi:AcrR family transcriptional regulator
VLTTGEQQDHNQQDYDNGDDRKHLDPPWCARGRVAFGHGSLLSRVSSQFTIQFVHDRYKVTPEHSSRTLMVMPRLWDNTIEAHRREVRDAILDTTGALVAEHGLRSVTMSQIAEETGIGRATLYKYFPGVEEILLAWHERQITFHLEYLARVRDEAGDAGKRLQAVLEAYALISYESQGHHDAELSAFLHRDQNVVRARRQVRDLIRELLVEAAKTGYVRDDVAPDELAGYCVGALVAASSLPSKAAVRRLVTVALDGLHLRA